MRQQELWKGGAWERPQLPPVPLSIPNPAPQRKGLGCRRSRRSRIIFGVFLLLIAALIGTLAVLSRLRGQGEQATWPGLDRGGQSVSEQTSIPRAQVGGDTRLLLQSQSGEELTLQEIYRRCIPSVVYIQARSGRWASAGSGVILSADGYIVTNEHVIAGAEAVQVLFHDNTALEARLVGAHAGYDLAVLKVEADGLIPAQFGNSAQLQAGDDVVAIGNPLGSTLRGTMTQGIVSAINRSVDLDGVNMSLIQTTAALNQGNSGGALVNRCGQVVGITTMKMMSDYSTIEGLGFAIPTRFAKGIVDQLIATGEARTPMMGVTVVFDLARYGGMKVQEVAENSDCYAKGLRPGDIIIAANGIPLTDSGTFNMIKEPLGVGDTVILTVERGGERFDLEILLMDGELFED